MKWTFEKLQEEALRYKSKGDFIKYSWGAYQAARNMNVLDKVVSHMETKHRNWTISSIKEEAKNYNSRGEFQKKSNAYQIALKRGLLDEVCSHMDLRRRSWTNEELAVEALKYENRTEFCKNNRKAYNLAEKRKILDQICSHMIRLIREDWTLEEIEKEAFKYNTRSDFKNGSPTAHSAANKKGILDQICSHMKRSGGVSKCEQELFDAIKSAIPSAKKMRAVNIKIEGKAHIKGFDIDVLIKERNLGVEMDGDYWHSVEGLRRSRKHWPEEDLINYHEIKDNYFLNIRGIKILHIKEADWKSDKQACIKKCLEFLGA